MSARQPSVSATTSRRLAALAALIVGTVACVPETPATPEAPVVASFAVLGAPHTDPALVPVAWTVSDPQADPLTCRIDGDGDGNWDLSFDPCPSMASRNLPSVAAGAHTARIEVSDGERSTIATSTYDVAAAPSTETFDIVIRPAGIIDADVLAAFDAAASRWEEVIARGIEDRPVTTLAGVCGSGSAASNGTIDDLVVNLSMRVIPPPAWAAPCVYGLDGLPRLAFVEVNPDLLVNLRTLDVVDEMAVHELGHALGFGVTWQMSARGLVTGASTPDPRFTGPRAIAETSALGRTGAVPIMTINDVIQPHWESAFFGPEVMASIPDGAALSRVTVASMADLGYAVDLDAADPYAFPLPPDTCITFSDTVVRCW